MESGAQIDSMVRELTELAELAELAGGCTRVHASYPPSYDQYEDTCSHESLACTHVFYKAVLYKAKLSFALSAIYCRIGQCRYVLFYYYCSF